MAFNWPWGTWTASVKCFSGELMSMKSSTTRLTTAFCMRSFSSYSFWDRVLATWLIVLQLHCSYSATVLQKQMTYWKQNRWNLDLTLSELIFFCNIHKGKYRNRSCIKVGSGFYCLRTGSIIKLSWIQHSTFQFYKRKDFSNEWNKYQLFNQSSAQCT